MRKVLRKQDRNDFNARIKRLEPAFAGIPPQMREDRKPWEMGSRVSRGSGSPVLMSGLGFGLALAALFAANNPETVQAMLVRSGWPIQFIQYATHGITLLILVFRPKATGRGNAAGLVVGAVAAIAVSNLDQTHLQNGLNYAGFNSTQDIMAFAQARTSDIANIDWTSVVPVSSSAK
jgi:hypothetical protein